MDNNLPYAAPESLGIPTAAISDFLAEIDRKRLCMHGFLLLRHGKVAAEGYWPPFDENRPHRMYSVSKSFTAVAVGMMIGEGRLSLGDRAADFFPEYLPADAHRYVREATVRDLLRMATCNTATSYTDKSDNFVKAFFADPGPKHPPGAFFHYDTAATTVLCGIVERLSGKPMLDFMRPVLDAIGFSPDATCVQTPEGGSWTGSGILCTARDLARFALLCMNQGGWNGRQLVDREFMRQATSRQIDNSVTGGGSENVMGYGYQFWCLRDGGFGCFGMGSQYALCMPDRDAILITTADTQGVTGAGESIIDAFYRLLARMEDHPLPEDRAAREALNGAIGRLSLPMPIGRATTPLAKQFSGRTYVMEPNPAGIVWMRAEITDDLCRLAYENASGEHELLLGMNRYEPQTFPEPYYGGRIGTRDRRYACVGGGAWADEDALLGTIYAVDDYLGSIKLQLTFSQTDLCGYMIKAAEWFFDEYQGFFAGSARA